MDVWLISACCVGFASLDVVCDELHDCTWISDCLFRGSQLVEHLCYSVV